MQINDRVLRVYPLYYVLDRPASIFETANI